MDTAGDIATAVVCGADAVMLGAPLAASSDAPAGGNIWSMTAFHERLPRGILEHVDPLGPLEVVLNGPAVAPDGRTNLMGGLRKAMAVAGHDTLKELQKAELVLAAGTGASVRGASGRGLT
jgi:IMP dehydrogenase